MNNLEETNYLIMKRKGEARYLRQKKKQILKDTKIVVLAKNVHQPKENWTNIDSETGPH